eukprot:TRINITY_DN1369_c0_g1_i2.p1 TRINITY_DN1369_c0_g1~~TRINITY_DN1369_c0_g1_i2.p1  ORF type:complete len:287 (+),score=50.15 TRINITY_DN1369_c0_g1_i2:227-1087(+)
MYATLQPDLLTASEDERSDMKVDPTNVVSWRIFRNNQFPYLEVRRPFILGLSERKWLATLSHWFIQVCHDKGLLVRLYTQNIDGLDYQTNIPSDFIVGVHGSLGQIGCEFCGADCDVHEFQEKVKKNIKDIYGCDAQAPKESTPIFCESCGKPGLKPKTVLYGRRLPPAYFESVEKDFPDHVDLLMIAGTSLTVGPANGLVNQVSPSCLRFICNREPVGQELGINYSSSSKRDVHFEGTCDEGFLELAIACGWWPDLVKYQKNMCEESQKLIQKYSEKLGLPLLQD